MVQIHDPPPLNIASQPSGKAPDFDSGIRQFESSRGNQYIFDPLAQPVEHLTFNQGVWSSNLQRDTILYALVAEQVDAQDLKSCGCKSPCRFDSGLRHHLILEEYPSLVEGTGLENREVEKSAQGFESLFLRHLYLISRDGAIWQLAGLITQRLLVQIRLPQPKIMVRQCSGYHARLSRERSRVQVPYEPPCGFIAQLAEHKTENLGVVGSIPTEATTFKLVTNYLGKLKRDLRSQLNWIEHLTTDQKVRGSTPLGRTIKIGKWLNLVEHSVWDRGVAGSNPVFPTI